MYVFRLHIRPQGGSADMRTTFEYCLKHELLGVGWRTESETITRNWDEYYKEACSIHGDLGVCKYINKWVSEGDLVWTRDPESRYYLARVTSRWEYWTCDEAKELDIDIANVFRCRTHPVGIDEVPGKVVASFRARRTIQEIPDEAAVEYSKHLWNRISGSDMYQIDRAKYSDPFMLFDDEETEDVLFLYLQSQGWYVIPNSRKADTMSYEYLAINPRSLERALAQVKTGNSVIDLDRYAQVPAKVFVFQSNDMYSGRAADNVVCVKRDDLLKFLDGAAAWLPNSLKRKMEIASGQ